MGDASGRRAARQDRGQGIVSDMTPPAFTCPCCGATSRHPADIAHRYCSRCHAFTGDPELGAAHLAEPCAERKVTSGE
jgi:hypothetical protein